MDLLIDFCNISTIIVCFVCKVPQILTIYKSGSIAGISLVSIFVELLGYTIVLCYNVFKEYPLLAYFEYSLLVVQDIILILLIYKLMGRLDVVKFGCIGGFLAIFYSFIHGIPHSAILPFLIQMATPISASSKIIQLKEIWRSKNSESVSILTWLISAYTCITRIVTTVIQTGDVVLLMNYIVALVLNGLIIISALNFKGKKTKSKKSTEAKKKIK